MNIRIVRTALLAIAISSFASTALAQSAPVIYDSTVVGEAPPECDLINAVIVGANLQCADLAPGIAADVAVVGNDNTVDSGSSVFGTGNTSSSGDPEQASFVVQVGRNNANVGIGNIQTGLGNRTTGNDNISTGNRNAVDGDMNLTYGQQNTVNGYGNVNMGSFNNSQGQDTVLIGRGNSATADGCVAIGSGAECDETDEFSVGNDYRKMRLTNVGDGRDSTDAVNVRQVAPVADALGGGANFNNGVFTGPTYIYNSGATYNNVGDALYDLDDRVTHLEASAGGGQPVEQGDNIEVDTDENGSQTVSVADNIVLTEEGSLTVGNTRVDDQGLSISGGPSMTSHGIDAGNHRVTSVANGRIEAGSRDAVNGGQVWALQQQWDDRWMEINNRLDGVEERVDAVGAQSAAMAMMASSSRMLPEGKVAVSTAWGQYGNKAAFAVGLNMRTSERSSFSMGISLGSGGKAMAGIGYSMVLN